MELTRQSFPLLKDTLNYLDIGVTGEIQNIVRYKNNKFVFNLSLQNVEEIKNEDFNLTLLNGNNIPLSNIQPGSLLGCLHPHTKKWMRCYVLSILHNQANVAFCDTGEITKTKKLKDISDCYKIIPAITFEAEIQCLCPHGKLKHLMENFDNYVITFEPFKNKQHMYTKKMKLTYKNTSILFIIKPWNPHTYVCTDDTNYNSLMFKNGSAVTIAKTENYDWRHLFVRSVDQFVNVCKEVQKYYENASKHIQKFPFVGDIVGVKCVDKFYRGKIIDILDTLDFSLYLIDTGFVISASIECIVDLSEALKKIPSTVCLVGLKDINLKPWTPQASSYISNLFENSTTMIMEYNDHDSFGLDSVTLTNINNNEDVNECLKELLKFAEGSQNDNEHNLNSFLNLHSKTIIPVKVENLEKIGTEVMASEYSENYLVRGSIVYMTGFVDLNEMYVRKLEDHNDQFEQFLDLVNGYCLSAAPITRPLKIGEIIGAQSTLDNSFYRGKVLKQNNDSTYLIQYIDFGDKDNVPISNIFEIPNDFMTPSNIKKITLNGVNFRPLNAETLNYITNLLSNYEPMIIDFSPVHPLENVILKTVNGDENVNERLNQLLNIDEKIEDVPLSEIFDIQGTILNNKDSSKLKKGDLIFITAFIDVHHIYVRKIEDDTEEFSNFNENLNLYCSAEAPIGKLLRLNDIIGAKSIADGLFYRAKVIKKINDVSYNVQFIDFGIEENVNLSNIVPLSAEFNQVSPTIIMVKLKDVPFSILNEAAHNYILDICETENLLIETIDEKTNEVILKTETTNTNINNYLNTLIFENNKVINASNIDEECLKFDSNIQSFQECNVSLQPGDAVYMTAFIDLNEMYVRKLENHNDEFDKFLDMVNAFCSSATPINRPLEVGEIVGALSTLDDGFYRGKVLKQKDDNTYLIQYIDFGDKDSIPISNIFEIPKKFMTPSTITKISLKGIKSSPLSIEASNYVTNLLTTCEPMIIDFDLNFPVKDVTLIIVKNNENVVEYLNKLLNDIDSVAVNNIVNDNYITEEEMPLENQNFMTSSNETISLKTGDMVYVTAYIDIYNIFVRKVDDMDELQQLTQRVNSYCSLGNTSESKPLELNQIVGAQSSTDGCFYRAKVIEKIDEKTYDTEFIDFGFEENVNVSNIVPLPIQLQQVKPSIVLVGLSNSNFKNLSQEGHRYLESLILLSEVMKIEFEDLSAVTLTVVRQEQNVIDYLNKLHVDDTIMDNTIIDNYDLPITSSMEPTSLDISIPQIPPLTNKSIVTIHAFVSLKHVYVSVPINKPEVDKFIKDLNVFCITSQPITRNPTVGEIFGIRSSINGSFNRGAIKEKLNENQYNVVLFDLGTEDIVSANSLVEIPEKIKLVPRSIYSVSLKDVGSKSLNSHAMSYVNLLCENMPLIIEFNENSPTGLNNVTLTTVKTQQSVNSHLEKLLTEKERDSPETVKMLSKGDIIYISSFVNLKTIYVRRINNGTDKFKSFLEDFSACCALENPVEDEPRIGDIVAAKEKNETKFYRAEIISKVDNEHFNVCFIDFGTRNTVHRKNIVHPSESQLQNSPPPTFIVGLDGFDLDPIKAIVMQYIQKISETETFLIDSITEHNRVTLISVNTKCNINKEITRLITNSNGGSTIQNDANCDTEKSIINYHYPPLNIPTQVWVAEKISSSKYSVHTYDSRLEFMRLEKKMFEDSKTLKSLQSVKMNMPCIVYFSPSWYRGEIIEIIDKVTVKVGLIDVGNFSIVRNIKEIFYMPSKYKGKSLLMNIEIQPEPVDKLSITTFKIIAKKHLKNCIVVEVLESSIVDQSYCDMDSVGLPSFSSTPIPEHSGDFQFDSRYEHSICSTLLCHDLQNSTYLPDTKLLNILTIKDIQYAKWQKGSFKTLTFLCIYQDYLVMRDHLIDDALTDLETKIQSYCAITKEPLIPTKNELCLAKYCDNLWYRAICIKTSTISNKNNCTVYFVDWGIEYSVNSKDIYEISKEFLYLPATAYKCYVKGVTASEWNASTINIISEYLLLTQVDCEIVDKLLNDSYLISCDTIKTMVDANM